ncbi:MULTISPECIES: hypothetical protein [Bacillus cereus group]|jgi:hypothetical protein|uniref:hypothetical protein n=1 Tax=Bacillus cereus group TaxID=86661 RepID=UPI000BF718DC|nr:MULTISPECIES: hypothetical protein [Bacillus cereus group]MBV6706468.1 hypothetical protein [Bacillus thuringiensis]PET23235.1 hypothetical protein CN513_03760 [Bacillus cereus]PET29834.1 hypothetical protein CN519_08625 [Bacillus cereus]PEU34538.1 hypothetical protein CN387_28910 [Bacillus cereus]PEV60777.1 hypothetical protein CN422_05975 [Bacillus cereus]
MKKFSVFSITLMTFGMLLFGLNRIIDSYSEPIILLGYISFLIGVVLSIIAIARREDGRLKFISLISFFVFLFFITWFESFQVLRIITWLKNIY